MMGELATYSPSSIKIIGLAGLILVKETRKAYGS